MGDETVPEIEYEALAAGVKDGSLTVIDVRNPEEIASTGRIPGSINMPLPEVPDFFKNLSEEDFKARFGFDKKSTCTGAAGPIGLRREVKLSRFSIESKVAIA